MSVRMGKKLSFRSQYWQRDYLRTVATVWRWLCQPWPLLISGALAFLIVLGGLLLPQLPGQLVDEPANAARWLVTTSSAYGVFGDLLRALGMFNVLHSPLLRLLMMLIGLIVSVQFAELVGGVLILAALRARLSAPISDAPLVLPSYARLYRLRCAYPLPPQETLEKLLATISPRFSTWHRFEARPDQPSQTNPDSNPGQETPSQTQFFRVLALRNTWTTYLRPLLMLGLLVALGSLWIMIVAGWQVTTPSLAPGDNYRSGLHDVEIHYVSPLTGTGTIPEETTAPLVEIEIAGAATRRQVLQTTQFWFNGVNIHITSRAPALLIAASGQSNTLARPGDPTTSSSVGLVFPASGSEQTLLLPDMAAGLRIVRLPEPEQSYVVELYRGEELQPVERFQISGPSVQTLTIAPDLHLDVLPVSGLQVEVLYLPFAWLLWIALALVLAGVAGFWKQPAFLVVEIANWPVERSVLTAQSDRAAEIRMLQSWCEQPTPPTNE